MSYREIGNILLTKLSSGELAQLIDCWDDGALDEVFYNKLIPRDRENNPEKYSEEEDD